MSKLKRVFVFFLFLGIGDGASAVAPTFMYQGRIVGTDGQPLEYSSVSFEFTVTSPDGTCVLYRELKNGIDMRNSKGVFDTPIGSGTRTFPLVSNFSLLDAFSNSASLTCDGGSNYAPSAADGRKLRVQFYDGVGWKLISPDQVIRSVPYAAFAGQADSASRLGSKSENDFILKNSLPLTACSGDDVLSFNGTNFICVAGGAGAVTNIVTGTGLTGGPITTTGTISIANGGVGTTQLANSAVTGAKLEDISGLTAGTYGGSASIPSITVDAKGRVTSVSTSSVTTLPAASSFSEKFLKSDGTSWSGQNIVFSDIKTSTGTPAFDVGSCGAHQTIAWSSLTDSFTCQNIGSLSASAITAGTLDPARLPSSVTDGLWAESAGSVSRASGNVGIGTTSPTEKLEVNGNIKATQVCLGSACRSAWPDSGGGGTVTNIVTGTGLTGGPITDSGTIAIANSGVGTAQLANEAVTQAKLETVSGLTAGTYGNATTIPSITVDNKGRITSVTTNTMPTQILVGDVKNGSGSSVFSTSACAANQALTWSSISDTYICQGIGSLNASAITAGTIDASRLPSSVTNALWSESGGDVTRATGKVGIGTASPAASAVLDVSSTTQGFLPPRLTTAQRNGLASPAAGLMVFDSTENKLYVYNGTRWAVASDSESGIFRAERSSNQSITNGGTMVTIIPTSKSIDPDNAFNISTGIYTVPLSGFYHFSGSVNLGTMNTYAGLRIHTDSGVVIANSFQQMSAGAQLYINASGSIYLNTGDKVRFSVWHWESGSINAQHAVMSGFRVGAGGNGGGGVADHLGNHVATQNLVMGSNWISGDGSDKGIRIDATGNVGIGTASPTAKLEIGGTAGVDGIKFPDGSVQTSAASGAGYQVKLGSFTAPTSTGNFSVTGLGFRPTFVRFWIQFYRSGAMPAVSTNVCTGSMTAVGQQALFTYANTGTTNTARNYIFNDRAIACSGHDAIDILLQATRASLDADGFTLNFSAVGTTGWTVNYEASGGSTTASTGSGTANYMPLWTSSTALGSSPVAVSGGNVGIGTASPGEKLTVNGTIESTSGGIKFPDGSTQTTALQFTRKAVGTTTASNGSLASVDDNFVSSVSYPGAGVYQYTFAVGFFSTSVRCQCNPSGSSISTCVVDGISTSGARVVIRNSATQAGLASAHELLCIGK